MADKALRYVVGGHVQATDDGIYLERAADARLLQHCRAGHFVYILTSRQLGKSSLMIRTAYALMDEGALVVTIDLQLVGTPPVADQWYLSVLQQMMAQLDAQFELGFELLEWWQKEAHLSIAHRFTQFCELVAEKTQRRIVVFVDEIDSTLALSYTDDFFIAIRALYGARAKNRALMRFSFVLIGVATPDGLIKNSDRTPFNIGHRLELSDFNAEEAAPLLEGLALDEKTGASVLRRVLYWTGGHPYLTLKVFHDLATTPPEQWRDGMIDERVASLFFSGTLEQPREDDNIVFVLKRLVSKEIGARNLLLLYRKVLARSRVPDAAQSFEQQYLKLSGVVIARHGYLEVRNRIYAKVFDRRWVNYHLPTNWSLLSVVLAALVVLIGVGAFISVEMYRRRAELAAENARRDAEAEQDAAGYADTLAIVQAATTDEVAISHHFELLNLAFNRRHIEWTERTKLISQVHEEHAAYWQRSADDLDKAASEVLESDPDAYLLLSSLAARKRGERPEPDVLDAFVERYGSVVAIVPGDGSKTIAAAFSPRGDQIATVSLSHKIQRWSAATGERIGVAADASAIADFDPYAIVWQSADVRNGELAGEVIEVWSRLGSNVGVIWEVGPPDDAPVYPTWDWNNHAAPQSSGSRAIRHVEAMQISDDGTRVLGVGSDVALFERSGKRIRRISLEFPSRSADFMPRGGAFVFATPSGATIYDAEMDGRGRELRVRPHRGSRPAQVNAVRFSPDGRWLLIIPLEGAIEVWRVADATPMLALGDSDDRDLRLFGEFCRRADRADADTRLDFIVALRDAATETYRVKAFPLTAQASSIAASAPLLLDLDKEVPIAVSSLCEVASRVGIALHVRSLVPSPLPTKPSALDERWRQLLHREVDLEFTRTGVDAPLTRADDSAADLTRGGG